MTRYILQELDGTLILTTVDIDASDNIAVPSDSSVLSETAWGLVQQMLQQASLLAAPAPVDTKLSIQQQGQSVDAQAATVQALASVVTAIGYTLDDQRAV